MAEPMAYVASCPHGHFVGVCVDEPAYAKSTAKDVADWIKRGCSVQHMTLEEARPLIKVDPQHLAECKRS